ncbi:MAG: glycosyltransferase family 4 protein [Thermoanaerobaculum sp.]
MRFALDARAAFVDPYRGFGRVVRELVPVLARVAAEALVVCVPAHAHVPEAWYAGGGQVLKLRRPRRGAFLFDGPAWAWSARRHRFDCLHLPAWGVPPGVPVPVVASFNDATPLLFPTGLSRWQKRRMAWGFCSLRRATVIHVPSRSARSQLARLDPNLESRATVVPYGVHDRFRPDPNPERSFVLGVGGGEHHKNWELMLEVYSDPRARTLPPLRLVGSVGRNPKLSDWVRVKGLEGRVLFASEVDEQTLVGFYQHALALVFPSRNEGFGLPALEAMACGCPVVAANCGALPEVCGDAAILLPPDDPREWLAALVALHESLPRWQELRERGLARARAFTWERTARELLALYRDAARRASSARWEARA